MSAASATPARPQAAAGASAQTSAPTSTPAGEAPYTLRQIEQMLGLGRSVVASLIDAGFVTPARGPRREYRFSFADLVLLRTAHALRTAQIPPRRVLRSLRLLRQKLPAELPLSGLRISAVGGDVAVQDGAARRAVESGQWLLDFDVSAASGTVAVLPRAMPATPAADRPEAPADRPGGPSGEPRADDGFARGERLETQGDFGAAEQAYRQAVAARADHAQAWLNLVALLCEDGRSAEAVALCDEALAHCRDHALLHFNRAIALEDEQRESEALASYERCLALEPALADAHYNAARLYERLGQPQGALRHFNAYRRLLP